MEKDIKDNIFEYGRLSQSRYIDDGQKEEREYLDKEKELLYLRILRN